MGEFGASLLISLVWVSDEEAQGQVYFIWEEIRDFGIIFAFFK